MLSRAPRVVVLMLLQAVTASVAFAECEVMPPFCEGFWSYHTVFDGTAVREETVDIDVDRDTVALGLIDVITPFPAAGPAGPKTVRVSRRVVTFLVHRAWRGVPAGSLEVRVLETPAGMYSFKATLGQRYLIVGGPTEHGYLEAYTCGATRRYEDADEQLAFLQQLTEPARGGRVYGNIRADYGAAFAADRQPERRVVLRRAGADDRTLRTADRFEFDGLEAGTYVLDIEVPSGTRAVGWGAAMPIDMSPRARESIGLPLMPGHDRVAVLPLADARGCASIDILLEGTASVSGSILASRDSLHPTFAELRGVDGAGRRTPAGESRYVGDGPFTFEGLLEGEYVLGGRLDSPAAGEVPPYRVAMLFSGAAVAHGFHVRAGEALELPPFTLPPFRPDATIDLTLRWADGAPVADTAIRILDVTDPELPEDHRGIGYARTDEHGRARIRALASRVYVVSAWTPLPRAAWQSREVGRAQPFTAGSGSSDVRLTLDPAPAGP